MRKNKRISSHDVFYAPARKGMSVPNLNNKSVGLVIPTVLNFSSPPVCVIDPHYEPDLTIKGGKHD